MKKIVLLPLDERPCNRDYAFKLFNNASVNLVAPDMDILGQKKSSANIEKLIDFLLTECKDADGLVLSVDMLIYGGLLPSRLHFIKQEEIDARLNVIKKIRQLNPKIIIYAFSCIMRCPKYSCNDEEPTYYEECGAEIHQLGSLRHKHALKLIEDKDFIGEEKELLSKIKAEYLNDFISRRNFNVNNNLKIIDLCGDIIDFLIIPQDDSAEYGFTAMDQEVARERIKKSEKQFKVLMYPGADEVALTLCAKMVNTFQNNSPKVFIYYASVNAFSIIPSYEDRPLGETLKYHILASGARLVFSVEDADFILAVSAPGSDMKEASFQDNNYHSYNINRNLVDFVAQIDNFIAQGKKVVVCDNAYANGADLELLSMLKTKNLFYKLAGYAGWNTSSNTTGTALAMGICFFHYGRTNKFLNFLAERLVEDAGYCSVVRKHVKQTYLDELGLSYFLVDGKQGKISCRIEKELKQFVIDYLGEFGSHITINKVLMPWNRMFEVAIDATYN